MTPGEFIQKHQSQIDKIFQKKYAEELYCIVPTARLGLAPDEVDQFVEVQRPGRPKRKVDPIDYEIRQKSIFISKNKWLSKEAIAIIERDFDNHLRTIAHSIRSRLKVNQLQDRQIYDLFNYFRPMFKGGEPDTFIFRIIAEIFAARHGHDSVRRQRFVKIVKNAVYQGQTRKVAKKRP